MFTRRIELYYVYDLNSTLYRLEFEAETVAITAISVIVKKSNKNGLRWML